MPWAIKIGFHLTPGQACDLDGADVLLNELAADTLLADKGYDADERVLERLKQQGKTAVIPPKCNRTVKREYDREKLQAVRLGVTMGELADELLDEALNKLEQQPKERGKNG
jgi:hypothetical protein